jgi:hypothetical protein
MQLKTIFEIKITFSQKLHIPRKVTSSQALAWVFAHAVLTAVTRSAR